MTDGRARALPNARSRRDRGGVTAARPAGLNRMSTRPTETDRLAGLLHEAGETHHIVWRITDGDDPDWASWYADWLLDLSELPHVLGAKPVRSHLVHALVQLELDYTTAAPGQRWQDYYARRLADRFGA